MTDEEEMKMKKILDEFEHALDEHIERHGRNARVYISGAMTGKHRFEYLHAFRRAELELNGMGYHRVVNPIHVWVCRWPWLYRAMEWVLGCDTTYYSTLLYDLWLLWRCDAICMLPDWQRSRGACIENVVAAQFDMEVINLKW